MSDRIDAIEFLKSLKIKDAKLGEMVFFEILAHKGIQLSLKNEAITLTPEECDQYIENAKEKMKNKNKLKYDNIYIHDFDNYVEVAKDENDKIDIASNMPSKKQQEKRRNSTMKSVSVIFHPDFSISYKDSGNTNNIAFTGVEAIDVFEVGGEGFLSLKQENVTSNISLRHVVMYGVEEEE